MANTAFVWLSKKIYKTKTYGTGNFLTFQEIATILIYGLGMGWMLVGLKSAVDAPLTSSPAATPLLPVLSPCGSMSINPMLGPVHTTLLFAPDTALTRSVVEAAAASLAIPDLELTDTSCRVVGYASGTALLTDYTTSAARQSATAAAIFFHGAQLDAASIGNYTLALSRDKLFYKGEGAVREFEWPALDKQRLAYFGKDDGPTDWVATGFVSMQAAIDRAIAAMQPGATATMLDTALVQTTTFPLQPYASTYGENAEILLFLLPIFGLMPSLMLSFMLSQFMLVEKAHNLVEGLRMMGMSYRTYYNSWFLVYSVLAILSAFVQWGGFCAMGYFPNTDLGVLLILLLLAGLCTLPFGFSQVANAKPVANDPEAARQAFNGKSFMLMLLEIGGFALIHFVPNFPMAARCVFALVPQIATMQGVSLIVKSEMYGAQGLGWGSLLWTYDGNNIPMLGIWGFLVLDAVLYMFLAVQQSNQSLKHQPMPPRDEKAHEPQTSTKGTESLKEVIRIENLGRSFAARPKPVVALSNLNLSMYEGQISCLLGHNGAGKTTTISILTGLFPSSEGDATIYGLSISKDMNKIRKISGVCPQHDLVFEALTCVDNLSLVGAQKGMSDEELKSGAVKKMLDEVGLGEEKYNARTGTLSGGQKRKLSLACALIGDPKFVLLDEPTAGMDPASRRTVWAVMSNAKPNRSIVLTTHFLDEADALGDRVAILHKGRLQCVGSTAELKENNGTAFHLTVSRAPSGGSSSELLALTHAHVPEASIQGEQPDEVRIRLPQQASAAFSGLFTELDASVERLGVNSYGLSIPTLQEVFLKITADADQRDVERAEQDGDGKDGKKKNGKKGVTSTATVLAGQRTAGGDVEGGGGGQQFSMLDNAEGSLPLLTPNWPQQLRNGLKMAFRLTVTDGLAFFMVFLFPGISIALTFIIPPLLDRTKAIAAYDPTDPTTLPITPLDTAGSFADGFPLPYAPATGALQTGIEALAATSGYTAEAIATAATLDETLKSALYGGVGAFSIGAAASTTTILHNASFESALPVALSLLDRAYLSVAAPGAILDTTASLLPYVGEADVPLPVFAGALVAPSAVSYILVFYGMIVVITLVKDRLVDKTTHQQMVMGLGPGTRWLIEGVFWSGMMWLMMIIAIICICIFNTYTPYAAGVPAFAVTVLLAVPSTFCFLALFNFLFWCRKNVEDVVAQSFCNAIQLLAFYPTLLISAIPVVRDSPLAKNIVTYTLMLVPINQITFGLNAIYQISTVGAYMQALFNAPPPTASDYFVFTVTTPGIEGSSPGPMACVIYSLCTAPMWFYLLYYIDVRRYYYAPRPPVTIERTAGAEDADVAEERKRVERGLADDALVRMVHLRKEFKSPKKKNKPQPNKVAVADLSLAVDGKGCFALLGPNGAGKTTTLSMLTGDLRPTNGEAWIAGYSVRTDLLKIFSMLGYCPQFGGLFPRGLSLKQHIEVFGELKGIPTKHLAEHVERVLVEFGLQEHADKWVTKLSGGTKRKLIAAIALACEPRVCFLDEPTTGVDVGTRQFLWDRINAKGARGCALILTTHYMEEADALANRVGIMCNGNLQVLGSPQHLKTIHGGGYRIELKGPSNTAADAKALIERLFASTKQLEAHGGFQVFEVGAGGEATEAEKAGLFKLGPVFAALDQAKLDLGIETYTLSQTTLEQVFLNISANQLDEDASPGQTPPTTAITTALACANSVGTAAIN